MAVPAHDERDFEFAKKYHLPIPQSIMPVDGVSHPGAERRHTISAIVQRPSDNKFMFLKWKQFGRISPVIGGIEGDEDALAAAEREVLEETGYTAKAVKTIGRLSESNFFAENKNIWRQKIDQPVVLELLEDHPRAVTEEEFTKHEVIWLTYEEALDQTSHKDNLFGLIAFVEGERAYTQK
jgi:8-oxo-dGTP pyrophosphatase MutT (NUDIX family)